MKRGRIGFALSTAASRAEWISDESCGKQHTKPGRADCVEKCWGGLDRAPRREAAASRFCRRHLSDLQVFRGSTVAFFGRSRGEPEETRSCKY
jgi:hypothetical protein